MSSNHAEDKYEGVVGEQRRRPPNNRTGITHKIHIVDDATGHIQEGYITANVDEEGKLIEIFLQGFGKEGSTMEGWVQFAAILFSVSLQYGAEFEMLARKISHMKFPPYGKTANPAIPRCRSVPDYIMHWLVLKFGNESLINELRAIDKELELKP